MTQPPPQSVPETASSRPPLTRIQKIVIWIDERRFKLGCGGFLVIAIGLSIATVIGAFHAIKRFPLYHNAAIAIIEHPEIQQQLGTPISHRTSLYDRATIEINGETGKARFHLILNGEKRSGDAIVLVKLISGEWKYQSIQIQIDGLAHPIELDVDELDTVSLEAATIPVPVEQGI